MQTKIKLKFILITVAILIPWDIAHAYLDPGSGSIMLQGIIASIATIGGIISLCWDKITSFVTQKKIKAKDSTGKNKDEL